MFQYLCISYTVKSKVLYFFNTFGVKIAPKLANSVQEPYHTMHNMNRNFVS